MSGYSSLMLSAMALMKSIMGPLSDPSRFAISLAFLALAFGSPRIVLTDVVDPRWRCSGFCRLLPILFDKPSQPFNHDPAHVRVLRQAQLSRTAAVFGRQPLAADQGEVLRVRFEPIARVQVVAEGVGIHPGNRRTGDCRRCVCSASGIRCDAWPSRPSASWCSRSCRCHASRCTVSPECWVWGTPAWVWTGRSPYRGPANDSRPAAPGTHRRHRAFPAVARR